MGAFDFIKNTFDYRDFIGVSKNDNATATPNQNQNSNSNQNQQQTEGSNQQTYGQPNDNMNKKTLYQWSAPNKLPHGGFDPKVIRSLLIVGIVVGLILLIMQEFLLILAIGSLVFVSYVISAAPADTVVHEITNLGVIYDNEFYPWEVFKYYFFTNRDGADILGMDRKNGVRLIFIVNQQHKQEIHKILYERIPYLDEAPKDSLDNMYRSILDKFTSPSA